MYFPVPLAGVAMIVFEIEALYNHVKDIFMKEEITNGCKQLGNSGFAGKLFPDGILRFPIAYAVALSSVFCLLAMGIT